MATNRSKYIDMGGLTPIVNGIRVNATKPGQLGTELTATEALYLDALTAGTASASKAVVLGSSKEIATLGTVGMTALTATTGTFSGVVSGLRAVVEDGAAVVLTAAQSGGLCIFDKIDGALFTLPAPVIGLWYEFIVVASVTSNSMKVITDAGTTFIIGSVDMVDTDTTFTHTNQDANGTNHISVLMAAASTNSTGGIKGTRFKLVCRTATTWAIEGQINHAGSVASPFSAS